MGEDDKWDEQKKKEKKKLIGPKIVGKNGQIYRFLCISWVLLTMVPRDSASSYLHGDAYYCSIACAVSRRCTWGGDDNGDGRETARLPSCPTAVRPFFLIV